MGYLIGQILFCLLIAVFVGGLAGWFLRAFGQRDRSQTVESEWRDRVYSAERERDDFYRNREEMAARLNTVERENDDRLARIRSLEAELEEASAAVIEPDSGSVWRAEETESALAERDETIRSLREEIDGLNAQMTVDENDPAARDEVLSRLEEEVLAARDEAREFRDRAAVAEKQSEMRADELDTVRSTLSSVRGDLLESERAREELENHLARYDAPDTATPADVEKTPAGSDETGDEIHEETPAAVPGLEDGSSTDAPIDTEARPEWLLVEPEGEPDNLKKIRGVGPVLERMMNELGVFHFHQIAGWTPRDVDWIASHIDTFPDRIERDAWIDQAGELASKSHDADR